MRISSNTYLFMPLLTVPSGSVSCQGQANRECQRMKGSVFPDSSRCSCLLLCLSQSYSFCSAERLSLSEWSVQAIDTSVGKEEGKSQVTLGWTSGSRGPPERVSSLVTSVGTVNWHRRLGIKVIENEERVWRTMPSCFNHVLAHVPIVSLVWETRPFPWLQMQGGYASLRC